MGEVTRRINVFGIVQGVGFRPQVARHARECGVRGFVCNHGSYVEIVAQGAAERVDAFVSRVRERAPERAEIVRLQVEDTADAPAYDAFAIAESDHADVRDIFIPPDIGICDDCARELYDPSNRRYLHPFINCTQCGPRLTILESLPYDRERTSMKRFPLCAACDHEYHDHASRRFDAQPVCCNDCGPEVFIMGEKDVRGAAAITRARETLAAGKIVAVKGIGGFHLACDATNEAAVIRLRELKRRPAKPFAVMARSLEVARRECEVTPAAEELILSHRRPIVLLDRTEGGLIAPSVAPGNPRIGVMVPYAPVQLLLFDYPDGVDVPDVLVMTSGNVSGAPICRSDDEVAEQISGFADCVLTHDRQIRTRADDSVVDLFEGRPYMVRRSRGYSPLPIVVPWLPAGKVLAVGGELKNTFCLGINDLFYPSSYIGDLADRRSVAALTETIERYEGFLSMRPEVVVCDLHPGYSSTRVAEDCGLPVVRVQHHYAHILSCMAENGAHGPVVGLALDGTGYGTDATIWGGELLVCDLHDFERVGHITSFSHTGGDVASREGWRIATSMLVDALGEQDGRARAQALGMASEAAVKAQAALTARGVNTVTSTSCGRLFDAVAAVLGICFEQSFEGEAACALQFAAERGEQAGRVIDLRLEPSDDLLPTRELFMAIVSARLAGADVDGLAWVFHEKLAQMIVSAAVSVAAERGLSEVALSGGTFQNRLLLTLVVAGLREAGLTPLTHEQVPPNDGGIALGQAVFAMANGAVEEK